MGWGVTEAVVSHHPVRHIYFILIQFVIHSQISHHSVPWQPWLLVESIPPAPYLAGDILFVGWGVAEAVVSRHPVRHLYFILIQFVMHSQISHHSVSFNLGYW